MPAARNDAVETVVTDRHFLEGPRWHEGRVWFSDFYAHEVLSAAGDGGDLRVEARVAGQPSGMGWLPDGRLLVASMKDGTLLRRESDGALSVHADVSGVVGGHLNDMVVDADGRAFVGDFGFDLMGGGPFRTTGLLRVDPDGSVTRVAEDLYFPNGMVVTPAGELLVCETFANRVSAFRIAADGSLSGRRDWARFGPVPSGSEVQQMMPDAVVASDGCCLDAEGAMWIADAVGGRAVRVREGGEIVDEVAPGTGVFACMLGGPDGRTLYLCAAPDFLEDARTAAREARLLAVRVDVPHAGLP